MGPRWKTIGTSRAGGLCAALLVLTAACSSSRSRPAYQLPPQPPPCGADGVFRVQAQRTYSSGSVCNLDDLRELRGELTIQRTGLNAAYVQHKGQYGHQASVDPYACAVWTNQTPTFSRNVMGATVGGFGAYRANVRPDGTLHGTLNLTVQSSSFLVPGCTASFNLAGQRVR